MSASQTSGGKNMPKSQTHSQQQEQPQSPRSPTSSQQQQKLNQQSPLPTSRSQSQQQQQPASQSQQSSQQQQQPTSPSRQQPARQAKSAASAATAPSPRSSQQQQQQRRGAGNASNPTLMITAADTLAAASVINHLAKVGGATTYGKIVLCVDTKEDVNKKANVNQLKNVEIKKIDTQNPDASKLASLIEDVDVLCLIPPADDTKFAITRAILQAADEQQVTAVCMLSWTGTNALDANGSFPMLTEIKQLEQEFQSRFNNIQAKTVVRANFYLQNLITYAKQIVQQNELPLPLDPGTVFAPLDAETLGQAVAKMLATSPVEDMVNQFGNQTFTFTGPKAVGAKDIADALTAAMGGQAQVKPKIVSMDEARKLLSAAQPPLAKSEIYTILETYTLIKQNRLDQVSQDLQQMGIKHPSLVESLKRDLPLLQQVAQQGGAVASGSQQ